MDEIVLAYLRKTNPAFLNTALDPRALKLRRVLDSLDMVEFLSYLERVFSITIRDQDVLARNFETVGSVITFVEGRVRRP